MPSFFQKLFTSLRSGKPFRNKGQTLVEYALILALLAIVMIAAFAVLSSRVLEIFSAITTLLDTAQGSH